MHNKLSIIRRRIFERVRQVRGSAGERYEIAASAANDTVNYRKFASSWAPGLSGRHFLSLARARAHVGVVYRKRFSYFTHVVRRSGRRRFTDGVSSAVMSNVMLACTCILIFVAERKRYLGGEIIASRNEAREIREILLARVSGD